MTMVGNLAINGTPMTMTLDTGASVSVITQKSYKAKFPNLKLHKSEILLKTYTGEPLRVYSEAEVDLKYNDQEVSLPLVVPVVEGNGPPLLGRN